MVGNKRDYGGGQFCDMKNLKFKKKYIYIFLQIYNIKKSPKNPIVLVFKMIKKSEKKIIVLKAL